MTRTSLPPEISLDLEVGSLSPGLVGLVETVGIALRRLDRDVTDDELLGISSAAFCNYVFDPDFNRHEERPREFSVLGEYFSNYGPWESISYYTSTELKDLTDLRGTELTKLVAFELAQGRPIVTLDPDLRPRLLTGYEISVDRRVAILDDDTELDLTEDAPMWQGDHDVFSNWLMIIRPSEPADWAASQRRQRVGVLRWAAEHGANTREFFQETGENYRPGLSGIRRFRDFLDGLRDPAGVEYAEQYMQRLRRSREAAARVTGDWAADVAAEVGASAVESHLEDAAKSWGAVAEAIASADTLVAAMEEVVEAESAALEALLAAATYFPGPFEAS